MEDTENKTILNQFDDLEEKVERLIEFLASQEEKKEELIKKNESLEEDLRKRVEIEQRYSEERTLVRSKIDGLLAKLGDILGTM